jgi:hypothetical protein
MKFDEFYLQEMPHLNIDGQMIDLKFELPNWDMRLIHLIKNKSDEEVFNVLERIREYFINPIAFKNFFVKSFNKLGNDRKQILLDYLPQEFIEELNL